MLLPVLKRRGQGPRGAAPVSVGRQEELWGVDVGKSLYCGFCGKECGKAWSAGSELVSLNNPRGLWGTGAVPSCLVLGLGVD